jgi:hypothetical protein
VPFTAEISENAEEGKAKTTYFLVFSVFSVGSAVNELIR